MDKSEQMPAIPSSLPEIVKFNIIRFLPSFLKRDGRLGLAKNVSILFVGNILSRALNLVSFILIARGLSVNDYGTLTVILSVITTMGDLINSGLTASTMRFTSLFLGQNNKDKIARLLSTTIINTVLVTIAFVVISAVFSGPLSQIFLQGNFQILLVVAAFGLFTTFLYSNLYSMLQGLQDFSGMVILTALYGIERLTAISILLFLGTLTIPSGVLLFVVTPFIPIVFGLFRLWKLHGIQTRLGNYDTKIIREMFQFGKWMSAWSVVAIIQSRMDIYLLSSLTSSAQVSYYDVAQKFSTVIGMGLGAYANVVNPKIAQITDREVLKKEVRKFLKVTLLMSSLLLVGIFVIPPIISLVFGNKYDLSIEPLRIMLFGLFFYMLTFPFNSAMYALGKSQVFFYSTVLALIGNSIASFFFLPLFGAVGASYSFVVVNIIAFVSSYYFYRKFINKEDEPKA